MCILFEFKLTIPLPALRKPLKFMSLIRTLKKVKQRRQAK